MLLLSEFILLILIIEMKILVYSLVLLIIGVAGVRHMHKKNEIIDTPAGDKSIFQMVDEKFPKGFPQILSQSQNIWIH